MGHGHFSAQGRVSNHQEAAEEAGEGGWDYPPLESSMEEEGFEEIGVYIQKRQNTVAQYIVMRPIMDLYEKYLQRPGSWVSWGWWEQEGLGLGGER